MLFGSVSVSEFGIVLKLKTLNKRYGFKNLGRLVEHQLNLQFPLLIVKFNYCLTSKFYNFSDFKLISIIKCASLIFTSKIHFIVIAKTVLSIKKFQLYSNLS